MTMLNRKTVDALALPAGKADAIFFDDNLPGFGLRLRLGNDGKVGRAFVVQFRISGATRRMKIGDATRLNVDQARKKAVELLAKATLGHEPAQGKKKERSATSLTFSLAVREYLTIKQAEVRPASFKVMTLYLTGRQYFGGIHATPLSKVDRSAISTAINKITVTSGASTAGRARAHLSAFFTWCMKNGHTDANPVINSVAPKTGPARDRVLTDNELAAIWKAATASASDIGRIVRLLMLTGCRRQEIGSLRWNEIDLEKQTITIPATRAKNGVELVLPLPLLALDVIRDVPQRVGRDFLFGERGAGFASWNDGAQSRFGIAGWRIHDVRRSVATGMCELGVAPHIVEAILNHQGGHKDGVAGIYNRAQYKPQMKAALARWADHIERIVTGREKKIVNFSRPK